MILILNWIVTILLPFASTSSAKFLIQDDKIEQFENGLQTIFSEINLAKDHSVSSKLSIDPEEHFNGYKVKRDSGCPGGEGNYGFNSFNFMTFALLVFNIVTNVNNNLNNNNNNANKNNINSISQDSQTVSSNTNAVNQLMVTVLPIPGKRSVENLIRQIHIKQHVVNRS